MNASEIITSFRISCSDVSTNDLSDTKALYFANRAYYKVINTIRKNVDEDFMSDTFLTDLVAGQSEYSFDTRGDDANLRTPIVKVTKLFVKYGERYTKARAFALSDQEIDDTILAVQVPSSSPLYKLVDYSVFLFPTPLVSVTQGVKVQGLYDPIPLTMATTEANIGVPASHHDVIVSHMRYMYFEHIKQNGEREQAYNDMLREEARMIGDLSERVNEPATSVSPDLSFFK